MKNLSGGGITSKQGWCKVSSTGWVARVTLPGKPNGKAFRRAPENEDLVGVWASQIFGSRLRHPKESPHKWVPP